MKITHHELILSDCESDSDIKISYSGNSDIILTYIIKEHGIGEYSESHISLPRHELEKFLEMIK